MFVTRKEIYSKWASLASIFESMATLATSYLETSDRNKGHLRQCMNIKLWY